MKATGIVRKLDELGRFVVPAELRRTIGVQPDDPLEVFVDGENIILRKYQPACIFCKSKTDVEAYRGKNICENCMKELRKEIRR